MASRHPGGQINISLRNVIVVVCTVVSLSVLLTEIIQTTQQCNAAYEADVDHEYIAITARNCWYTTATSAATVSGDTSSVIIIIIIIASTTAATAIAASRATAAVTTTSEESHGIDANWHKGWERQR